MNKNLVMGPDGALNKELLVRASSNLLLCSEESWKEHRYGSGSQQGLKTRLTVLVKASSNLANQPSDKKSHETETYGHGLCRAQNQE
jgi:hypothetical protein